MFVRKKDVTKWCIVLGNQLITEERFKSADEAQKYLDKKPWDIILNVAIGINQIISKEK